MVDKRAQKPPTLVSFGTKGAVGASSNSTDMDPVPKAIVVTSIAAGANIAVVPSGESSNTGVPFVGVVVGFSPPYRVRRVLATGTTCAWATVDDGNELVS